MISACEAGIRDMNKLSDAAIAQMEEIGKLIEKEVKPYDYSRGYLYYNKPLMAETRVMLLKLGYELPEGIFYEPGRVCINWQKARPHEKYRGPKIT